MFNPISAGTNYFWHHWQVISASRFVPSVMFTTLAGDEIISITPTITAISAVVLKDVDGSTVATVDRGMTYQASATVTTDPANSDARLGLTWAVLGNTSARTRISQTGVLLVSPTEASTSLKIVANDSNENSPVEEVVLEVSVSVVGESSPMWPVVRPEDLDATAFAATTAYAKGDFVTLAGGEILEVTTAGTSGATAPTAPAIGATVTSGTVTFTRFS